MCNQFCKWCIVYERRQHSILSRPKYKKKKKKSCFIYKYIIYKVKSIPPSAELIAPALLVRLTEEFFF